MTEPTARSMLRLVAVVTILIAAIPTTTGVVNSLTLRWSPDGGTLSRYGLEAAMGWLLAVVFGIVLWALSSTIARHVVQ